MEKERIKCEVYSRVCGYLRPTSQWNEGKIAEFKDRLDFKNEKDEKMQKVQKIYPGRKQDKNL